MLALLLLVAAASEPDPVILGPVGISSGFSFLRPVGNWFDRRNRRISASRFSIEVALRQRDVELRPRVSFEIGSTSADSSPRFGVELGAQAIKVYPVPGVAVDPHLGLDVGGARLGSSTRLTTGAVAGAGRGPASVRVVLGLGYLFRDTSAWAQLGGGILAPHVATGITYQTDHRRSPGRDRAKAGLRRVE
jgi:hypothetical protein